MPRVSPLPLRAPERAASLLAGGLALLLAATGTVQAQAAAPGATVQNTAALQAGALSVPSNTVTLRRQGACVPQVGPDGSTASPSRTLSFVAPGTVTVPYTVTQTGLRAGAVTLAAELLTPTPGVTVTVLAAQSGSAALQPLTDLTLAPGEQRAVLLGVSASGPVNGPLLVNLTATCADGTRDASNVTRLDALQNLTLLLTHTVMPAQASVGDAPTFTAAVQNPAGSALQTELRVTLPAGLAYVGGSGSLSVPGGSVRQEGNVLIFTGVVPAGRKLQVTYRAVVLAGAAAQLTAVASATGVLTDGTALTSNEAGAALSVTAGVFDRRATLTGEVFIDANGNSRRDPGETPLAGVRVLLANGVQSLTDDQGRYTFRNLVPGSWLVTLDRGQAPFQAAPGLGTRTVDVAVLTTADFALLRPQATLSTPVRDGGSVQQGPLRLMRTVKALPGGGTLVTLVLTSSVPVTDVVLSESLPDDSVKEFRFATLTGTRTLTYVLPGPAADSDPQLSWRLP
ncbi:SdrD B-like domain-containing protein [Deinococcus aquiradiocola]|uniref:DUF11 domain-containing protein n=1 Tax=Deinococcus aquiradiocola TaxID=393059 RepID=A0A917PFA2_9DEIO|nr:SdrD B-like domain-containing protein [Deinococcus aquiradiocola]GGJ74491.1 hypothetical protein GCM10008939_18530 [Deinococcus aquiradiocola]